MFWILVFFNSVRMCSYWSPAAAMTQTGGLEIKKMGSDETLERHKLNMAAVSTKQADDIIASAVVVQFPANWSWI